MGDESMRKRLTAGLLGGLVACLGMADLQGQTESSPGSTGPSASAGPPAARPEAARPAAAAAGDARAVDRLIQQLGAPEFMKRQQAMTALSGLGRSVVEPVQRALQSEDPEVRLRAKFVLRVLRDANRERVLQAFLAGDEPEVEADLPGWPQFRELVGDQPEGRTLYAQMLQDEADFLDTIFHADVPGTPVDISRELAARTFELQQQLRSRQAIPISSVSALLLVAAGNNVDLASQSGLMTLCYRTEFDRAIRSGPQQLPLRRMLGRVVAKDSDESLLAQRLHFTLNYELPEGLDPARVVLHHRVGNPHIRQFAILVVAKLGREAEDTRILERTLDDDTEIAASHRLGDRQITTQLRDVALASLVHRAGEPLAEYGLADVRLDATLVFQTISVGFASDADRQVAIQRWRASHVTDATEPETPPADEPRPLERPPLEDAESKDAQP